MLENVLDQQTKNCGITTGYIAISQYNVGYSLPTFLTIANGAQ